MSTSVKVQIHLPRHKIVSMSSLYDGTPDFMLTVIHRALAAHGNKLTSALLLETFLSMYDTPESRSLVEATSTPYFPAENTDYEYIIMNGQLSIRCRQLWAKDSYQSRDFAELHPLDYPARGPLVDEYRIKVADTICDAWAPLKQMGYTSTVSGKRLR